MNAWIADILLARIEAADLAFVDKTAGLTRAITDGRNGKPVTFPVGCNVNDPLACEATALRDLLPDPKYRSVLFFEGESTPTRIRNRVLGTTYETKLRLVVWLNCEKLGGSCNCGDAAQGQLIDLLNRRLNDTTTFRRLRSTVVGGAPTRGAEIFSRYTFDEKATQYLHFPFDFFALDLSVSFYLAPGCSEESVANDVSCWQPPVQARRRYPREFTVDELNDPNNGLTTEQRAAICS